MEKIADKREELRKLFTAARSLEKALVDKETLKLSKSLQLLKEAIKAQGNTLASALDAFLKPVLHYIYLGYCFAYQRLIQRNCIPASIFIFVLELLDLDIIPVRFPNWYLIGFELHLLYYFNSIKHNHSIYDLIVFFVFGSHEYHIFYEMDQLDHIVHRNDLNNFLAGHNFQHDSIEHYNVL
ncbi:hypothetical protein DL764_000945 [Monosporascus ibericus]|uniref:Uncharacterized protein n=1 Tax=Monosporascus ibericus TaxID=155417 RepID=A0A4Q4TRK9_9PEZI|nr:hypothetical protein DL764_000945 [Monosporascus ibericus]